MTDHGGIIYTVEKSVYDQLRQKANAKMKQHPEGRLRIRYLSNKDFAIDGLNEDYLDVDDVSLNGIVKKNNSSQIQLNEHELETIISRGKHFVYDREKIPHIELQRSKFLSQIFYERKNQQKFEKFLREANIRKRNSLYKEQREKVAKYETDMLNEKKSSIIRRNRLTKDQLLEISKRVEEKIAEKQRELEKEKTDQINREHEQEDTLKTEQEAATKKRKYIRQLIKDDLTTKTERIKLEKLVEKEKEKMNYVYNSVRDVTAQIKIKKLLQRMEEIETGKHNVIKSSYETCRLKSAHDTELSKVNIGNILGKSSKNKTEESVKIARENFDCASRKKQEQIDNIRNIKNRESEQRKKNNLLTDYIIHKTNEERAKKMLECTRCWENDIKIKIKNGKTDKNEDLQRLKNVKLVYERENLDFLHDAENILQECLQTGKPAFPIVKVIQTFKNDNNILQNCPRQEIYCTQIAI